MLLEDVSGEVLGCPANEGCCAKLVLVESVEVDMKAGDGAKGDWIWWVVSGESNSGAQNEGNPRISLYDPNS